MTIIPPTSQVTRQQMRMQKNPYEGRWRNWYSDIADWMLRNPGGRMKDCASELHRAETTISFITTSDMFKEYYARRKEEFSRLHDERVRGKLLGVAECGLDNLLATMKKRGDQVPMQILADVTTSALDRLGFGPKLAPTVNVNVDNRRVELPPAVTPAALEEAREALRRAEQRRLEEPLPNASVPAASLSAHSLPLLEGAAEAPYSVALGGVEE